MKKKSSSQEFKAVEFMRKQRDELSRLYSSDPVEFWARLKTVRAKFKNKFRQKEEHTA